MLWYVLGYVALGLLAAATVYLAYLLRDLSRSQRLANLLLPLSQMLCVIYGLAHADLNEGGMLAAQEAHEADMQRAEAEAAGIRCRLDAGLAAVEEALVAGDTAQAETALAGAEYVVRPPEKRFCEHPAVDALLAAKAARCKKERVVFTVRAEVPLEVGMQPVELCAVFANALDNAINACEGLAEGARWIEVEARCAHGFFSLIVRNSCASDVATPARCASGGFHAPLGEKRRARAQRADGVAGAAAESAAALPEHGWGLSIIEAIMRRHDGDLSCTAEHGVFTLSALWRL